MMFIPAIAKRAAILLLLLCMPFQLVSAVALDCLHADSSSAMKVMACHATSPSPVAATDESENLTQCQKCALDLLLLAAASNIDLTSAPLFIPVADLPQQLLQTATPFLPPLQRPPLISAVL